MKMKFAYPVTSQDYRGELMGFSDDYEKVFPYLKKCGYDGIELLIRNPYEVDTFLLDKMLNKYELKLAAIGTAPMQKADKLFLLSENEEVRTEALNRCLKMIELCSCYGAVALIGKYRGTVNEELKGCKRADLLTILHTICEQADELNVNILIEPQNKASINNINTIDDALNCIKEIKEKNIGMLADTYHMDITEESITESIKRAGNKIGFIHMSDSERKIPGEGGIDIHSVMTCLKQIGYEGYVSFEINQKPDSATAARICLEQIKQLAAE